MNKPSSVGVFCPMGSFEANETGHDGWHDRLVKYYLAQSPEEQLRLYNREGIAHASGYAIHVSGKFYNEPGSVRPNHSDDPAYPPYGPIEPHEVPRSFDTVTYKELGSLIALADLAVDEPMKAIIEHLEPDVHQFIPIEIRRLPKRVPIAKTYYLIVIGNYLDSFVPEKDHKPTTDRTGYSFSKSIFGNAHLWRERRVPAITCLSDGLQAEIKKAGLRMPKLYKMKEV